MEMNNFLNKGRALSMSDMPNKAWISAAEDWMNCAADLEPSGEILGVRGLMAAELVKRGNLDSGLISSSSAQQLSQYLDAFAVLPYTILFEDSASDKTKPAFDGLEATLSRLCPGGAPYEMVNPWIQALLEQSNWSPGPLLQHLSNSAHEQIGYAKSKSAQTAMGDYFLNRFLVKSIFPMLTQTSWRPEPHEGYRCMHAFIDTTYALSKQGIVWPDRIRLMALVYRCEPPDLLHCLVRIKQQLGSSEPGDMETYFPLHFEACTDAQIPEAMDSLVKFLSTEERYRKKAPDPFSQILPDEPDECLEGAKLMRLHHPQLMAIVDAHKSLLDGYAGCGECLVEPFRSLQGKALPPEIVFSHNEVRGIQQTPGLFDAL